MTDGNIGAGVVACECVQIKSADRIRPGAVICRGETCLAHATGSIHRAPTDRAVERELISAMTQPWFGSDPARYGSARPARGCALSVAGSTRHRLARWRTTPPGSLWRPPRMSRAG